MFARGRYSLCLIGYVIIGPRVRDGVVVGLVGNVRGRDREDEKDAYMWGIWVGGDDVMWG